MNRIQKIPKFLFLQFLSYVDFSKPKYVVKSLIENSIDANSTCIKIELKNYGLSLIKVEDDGFGIYKSDLFLALRGCASSKIFCLNDLKKNSFYGFNGISLSIISSISKIKIISKPKKQDCAWSLYVDYEKKILSPDLYNNGTSISVIDLYYNFSDKLKFSTYNCCNYININEIIHIFVLGNLNIEFHVKYNNKMIVYPKCFDFYSQKNRLKKIIGKKLIDNSFYIDISENNVILKAWFFSPESKLEFSLNKKYIYVNNKFIKSSYINNIINYSYYFINKNFICKFYCIYIYIDSLMIDMSFYKKKLKMLFHNEVDIYDILKKSIVKLFSDVNIDINKINNDIGKNFFYKKKTVSSFIKSKNLKLNIGKNIYELLSIFFNKILLLRVNNDLLIVDILKCRKFILWNKCFIFLKKFGFLKKNYLKTEIKIIFSKQLSVNFFDILNDLGIEIYYKDNFYYLKSFPKFFENYNINYNFLFIFLFEKIISFKFSYNNIIFYYKFFINCFVNYIFDDFFFYELKDFLYFINKNNIKFNKMKFYSIINSNYLLFLI